MAALPENCNMEPARSRRTGILQVKEFSTGKGIKPPIEARFLQVKEKRQPDRRTLADLSVAIGWTRLVILRREIHRGHTSGFCRGRR